MGTGWFLEGGSDWSRVGVTHHGCVVVGVVKV